MASRAHPTNLKMRKESNSSTAFPFSWLGFSFISWFLSFRASSNLDKYCSNPCLDGRGAASDGSSPLLRWRSSLVPSLTSSGVLLNKSLSPLRSTMLPPWSAVPAMLQTESPSTIRLETEGMGREFDLSCSCWSFDSVWLSSSKEEKQKYRVMRTGYMEQHFSRTGLGSWVDVSASKVKNTELWLINVLIINHKAIWHTWIQAIPFYKEMGSADTQPTCVPKERFTPRLWSHHRWW